MSTRSGKRIHDYLHDSDMRVDADISVMTERKTRSKRFKENVEQTEVKMFNKSKKRNNYVSYPTDEEIISDLEDGGKTTLLLRRETLKEHNYISENNQCDVTNNTRKTRRTKKIDNDLKLKECCLEQSEEKPKPKKNKRKNKSNSNFIEEELVPIPKMKSKRKKKGRRSSSIVIDEKKEINFIKNTFTNSFHSAAGSPVYVSVDNSNETPTKIIVSETDEAPKIIIHNVSDINPHGLLMTGSNSIEELKKTLKEKALIKKSLSNDIVKDDIQLTNQSLRKSKRFLLGDTIEKIELSFKKSKDITFDKETSLEHSDSATHVNNKRKLSVNSNDSFPAHSPVDTTYETHVKNIDRNSERKSLNHTNFDKKVDENAVNTTSNKSNDSQRELLSHKEIGSELNSTYDKTPQAVDNIIEEKQNPVNEDNKLDTTFDKSTSKSSLISSDSSKNETVDRDEKNISYFSITSDESKENIVNTTPLLIESSMEESQQILSPPQMIQTPLKREGTFTKDGPEISDVVTPTRRKSLPSPHCTPYPTSKSLQKERVLNVTHSLEKKRSSFMEAAPRLTKVMFCSPINNEAVVSQQKRKVIKSNLKGSNKSFVLEDNATGRRRSRPRTASAAAKLTESLRKCDSPSKINRTRLPNFAALHQRQFNKMESLDECQQRRAKRAKRLLTPTGGNALAKASNEPKKTQSEKQVQKKPETPSKRPELNRGFTRFGFKLNLDVNPFSIPSSSTATKPKEIGPKVLTRQTTMPSLTGKTSVRKELAKQTVLRENSFADRTLRRNQTRTIIKGVRTNRRFELQMKMRNIET